MEKIFPCFAKDQHREVRTVGAQLCKGIEAIYGSSDLATAFEGGCRFQNEDEMCKCAWHAVPRSGREGKRFREGLGPGGIVEGGTEDAAEDLRQAVFPAAVAVAEGVPVDPLDVPVDQENAAGVGVCAALELDQEPLEAAPMGGSGVLAEENVDLVLVQVECHVKVDFRTFRQPSILNQSGVP